MIVRDRRDTAQGAGALRKLWIRTISCYHDVSSDLRRLPAKSVRCQVKFEAVAFDGNEGTTLRGTDALVALHSLGWHHHLRLGNDRLCC